MPETWSAGTLVGQGGTQSGLRASLRIHTLAPDKGTLGDLGNHQPEQLLPWQQHRAQDGWDWAQGWVSQGGKRSPHSCARAHPGQGPSHRQPIFHSRSPAPPPGSGRRASPPCTRSTASHTGHKRRVPGPRNSSQPRTLPPGNLLLDGSGNLKQVPETGHPVSGWLPNTTLCTCCLFTPRGPSKPPPHALPPHLWAKGHIYLGLVCGPHMEGTEPPSLRALPHSGPSSLQDSPLWPLTPLDFMGAQPSPSVPGRHSLPRTRLAPAASPAQTSAGSFLHPKLEETPALPGLPPPRVSSPPTASEGAEPPHPPLLWPPLVSPQCPAHPRAHLSALVPAPAQNVPFSLCRPPHPLPPVPLSHIGGRRRTRPSRRVQPQSHHSTVCGPREVRTRGQGAWTAPPLAAGGWSRRVPALSTTRKQTG